MRDVVILIAVLLDREKAAFISFSIKIREDQWVNEFPKQYFPK
jgi:hypothetical protein